MSQKEIGRKRCTYGDLHVTGVSRVKLKKARKQLTENAEEEKHNLEGKSITEPAAG